MTKERSPNYPAVSLDEAIELARALYSKEKRTSVSPEVAARALGYTSLSGPARVKLAALKKYGLIEGDTHGVKISDLALRILISPQGSDEQMQAIQEAALKPDIFKELAGTHAEASDDALRSHLMLTRKFTEEGTRHLIRAFRDTFALAKLKDSVYSDETNTTETEIMNPTTTPSQAIKNTGKHSVRVLNFMLAKDVTAEIRLVGERLKPAHLEGLKQHIELTKKLWESDEEEQ
ncbi:MAG TPA: hypothetical protein VJL56_01830 [Candidatus Bathyarchaeia archaeon]|nr:hypothetical protein [Candidatus Bathyarchaeia archaeon]